MPKTAEAVTDNLLTGIETPVNPENIFTMINTVTPQSIDKITDLIPCLTLIIFFNTSITINDIMNTVIRMLSFIINHLQKTPIMYGKQFVCNYHYFPNNMQI